MVFTDEREFMSEQLVFGLRGHKESAHSDI
jgi:hypothetical protein